MLETSADLKGKRILLVEDELFLGMDIKETLERSGAIVFGPILDRSSANQIAKFHDIDGAILDLNVGGGDVSPVATYLQEHSIACLFYTGDARRAAKMDLDKIGPIYEKPMRPELLVGYLAEQIEKAQKTPANNSKPKIATT